ncbi:ClpX C4-type zinc finger protein [Streptomyces sediminimaris]|uniref:ClpX C4-type zinc finger protein n=1 Tax=Streptomyces sediminimaris TaxID=3383721 RepID=UPI00399B19A7
MSPEPTVDQLIQAAHAHAASDDPLDLLDAVLALTRDVSSRSDLAVDQIMKQARDAGYSWTVIGERLGVSRQAARQRYNDRVAHTPATLGPVRGREVQAGLAAALDAAEADQLAEAGTEHILLGLLTDGVAAATLEQLGVSREKIRDAGHRLFGRPTDPAHTGRPVFSAEARAALAAAERLAAERTPGCVPVTVTTPQLLAVVATNPGSRARRVLNDLGVDVADIKRLLHCYINVPRIPFGRRSRRGRPGKKQPGRCSFCGHPRSQERRLVAGPDVWICSECVAVCGEILARPADAET